MEPRFVDKNVLLAPDMDWSTVADDYEGVREMIEAAPEVDAEPVVHAHWEYKRSFGGKNIYVCSLCGRREDESLTEEKMRERYPYCHCGAKMDEEAEK